MKTLNRCPGLSEGSSRGATAPGVTLLELTVVLLVLLSLIVVIFIGGSAWKKGSDRAMCIVNLENIQKGLRGYSNLYGYNPGDTVAGLESKVIGLGKFVEQLPDCPGGGTYGAMDNTIPPIGTLYTTCSLATSERHEPADVSGW